MEGSILSSSETLRWLRLLDCWIAVNQRKPELSPRSPRDLRSKLCFNPLSSASFIKALWVKAFLYVFGVERGVEI